MKVMVLANATYADPPTRRVFDHVAARGIEVLLAMPKRITHPFGPARVPQTPWDSPVRVELLDTWYQHENGTHVWMKGIPRLIREFRPDVIHCVMEPWSITCLIVLSTLALHGAHRPRFCLHPVETLPGQGAPLVRFIRLGLYKQVLARADHFVGWSSQTVRAAVAVGVNGTPLTVAPAVAVDTDTFTPLSPSERAKSRAGCGWGPDDIVVGFVGRFEPEKGILDLLGALDLAVQADKRLRLAFLGSGSLSDKLMRSTSTRPWMSLHAASDAVGVARYMGTLDLLIVPSVTTPRWEEQFGLVVIEAMACGTPVIATRSGALPETVGDAGILVPENDPESLSHSILSLARSGHALADMRRKGLEHVERRFTPQALCETLTAVWLRNVTQDHV